MTRPETIRPGFAALATHTDARVALGRTGPRIPWSARAPLLVGDAVCVDSVADEVPQGLATRLRLVELTTRVQTRADCLRDPTSASALSPQARARLQRCRQRPDVQLILCDGLSPPALTTHARPLLAELTKLITRDGYRTGTPLFVRNARAPVQREIQRLLRPRALCLVVGQRPTIDSPVALTAFVLCTPRPDPHTIIRNIGAGGVTPRRAARMLAHALASALGNHGAR